MQDKKQKILKDLFARQRFGIKPGLERTEILLEHLGHPERKLPAIHIAGTNGKGSVCSMLASVLTEAGYKTGLYTSPHFTDFNERIRINGFKITDNDLVRGYEKLVEKSNEIEATFFEITTVLAFYHFAKEEVEIAVIETGMGGRFDSTSTLNPLICGITSISLEHTKYLGNDIQEVAFEKAGIIKPNIKTVVSNLGEKAFKVIESVAGEKSSEILEADNIIKVESVSYKPDITTLAELSFDGIKLKINYPLCGEHQLQNLKTALAILLNLKNDFRINNENIIKGLKNIKANTGFSNRTEIINRNPLLIIDAAHNPEAVKRLASTLKLCGYKNPKFNILFGALNDKNITEMLQFLKPFCSELIISCINDKRGANQEEIRKTALELGFKEIVVFNFSWDAVKYLTNKNEPSIITGSFYLIGEILPFIK